MFAGVLMLVYGVIAVLVGIVSIVETDVYARVGTYLFRFDIAIWGWIHLIIGVVVALTGLSILRHVPGAKTVGVGIVSIALIANFLWLPYQPLWALVAIAIDIFIIWALCTDLDLPTADRPSTADRPPTAESPPTADRPPTAESPPTAGGPHPG
nr:hypothetical protein [Streptomyces kasugaensis]